MDEAVINGANLFFAPQFGIDPNSGNKAQNQWLLGLVNAAPYVGVVPTFGCVPADFFFFAAVLCYPWLLAHRTSQQLAGSSGHHLRLCPLLIPYLHLARCHQFMASSLRCSLCLGDRHWPQVLHCPRVRSRVCPSRHSRCSRHDVANVDCIWYHAGLRRGPCLLQGS
jgi:hypothetical protein